MTHQMKGLPRCLPIVLASMAIVASCARPAPEEVESEAVVTVKTTAAVNGAIRGVIHATALVAPAPGAELVVIAPEAARIADIPHAEGERVRTGDLLVRFEIPGATADLERQTAEVRRAQAAVVNATANQTRARDLFTRGVAARKEVEDAERQIADAQAALEQAQASRQAAATVAARSAVSATFDGLVARRYHNPGDLVEPSATDPVLRVIDPARLQIVASVSLRDAPRVTLGASGRLVTAPSGSVSVALKVVSRPSIVDPGTATIPVRLAADRALSLAAGTPVEVEIDAEQHTAVVLVPDNVVIREGEETLVVVVADGKATRRPVQVGLTDGQHIEIVSGLTAGERVVVEGQAGLPDGTAVSEAKVTDR